MKNSTKSLHKSKINFKMLLNKSRARKIKPLPNVKYKWKYCKSMSLWLNPPVTRKLHFNASPKSKANSINSSNKSHNPSKKILIKKESSIPKEPPSPEGQKAENNKSMSKTSKPTSAKSSNKLLKLTKNYPSCTKLSPTRVNHSKSLTFQALSMPAENSKNIKPSSTVKMIQDPSQPKWTSLSFKETTKTLTTL